eukprot:5272469-Pyramimonas_sp.AAC.1
MSRRLRGPRGFNRDPDRGLEDESCMLEKGGVACVPGVCATPDGACIPLGGAHPDQKAALDHVGIRRGFRSLGHAHGKTNQYPN